MVAALALIPVMQRALTRGPVGTGLGVPVFANSSFRESECAAALGLISLQKCNSICAGWEQVRAFK